MRIILLALLLTLGSSAQAFAQITSGARAGVSFAKVTFEPGGAVSADSHLGPTGGVFMTLPLPGPIAVQPEVLYVAKGTSLDLGGIASAYVVDYLEVPLLARYELPRGLYVAAGPSVAYRLRARHRIEFDGSTEAVDLADAVKTVDLGIVGALGLQVGRWVADARYTHGLADIDADTTDDVRMKNRAFAVTAGIRF